MATTETTAETVTLEDVTIVDTDSHVSEQFDELLSYMDNAAVRRLVEKAVSRSNVARDIFSSSHTTPEFAQTNSDDSATLVHEGASGPETKIELMNEFGIDFSILSPGSSIGLATVNHDQTAVELARAYNSWMADTFYDTHDGFRATILVPNQKPDLAAEEIDNWANEDDTVGVQLPGSGLIPPAGHDWYSPIYEAAERAGLPIVMHGGNSSTTPTFPVQRYWSETFVEDHFFTFPIELMWHLNSLVFQGVPEKFPDLEFVLQEGGVEWLPWFMWRMDDHYLQNSQDVPILNHLPSEYIRDQFYFTTQPLGHTDNTRHLASMLEMAGGADTVMFSSDHPHADFDPPAELFTPIQGAFAADELAGMMGETAADVFGIRL